MKISLITTVLNEGSTIDRFLDSILRQALVPAEVVIVDGGSADDTVARIEAWRSRAGGERIRLIIDPSCSRRGSDGPIARGRNRAITEARHDIIACADAGCVLHERWLERITAPFNDPGVSIVGGWYVPARDSVFRRALAVSWVIPPENLSPDTFIPSSRSLAFRREVWKSIGGYPESSLYGEDTVFILRAREQGHSVSLVADALVEWQIPKTLKSFARLAFRYGFGDGFHRVQRQAAIQNAGKVIVVVMFCLGGALHHWAWIVALVIVSGVFALRRRLRRLWSMEILILLPLIGVIRIASDTAYLAGYLRGTSTRRHPLIVQEA